MNAEFWVIDFYFYETPRRWDQAPANSAEALAEEEHQRARDKLVTARPRPIYPLPVDCYLYFIFTLRERRFANTCQHV